MILPDLMSRLDGLIRELNPYYTGFRQMNQELIEAEQAAAESNIPFVEPKMFLVHRPNEERGRFNDPVNTSEMAVVFTGADGVPPAGNRIRIYPYGGALQEISDCNANRDPMVYPLLFPRGELGTYLKHKNQNISKLDYKLTKKGFELNTPHQFGPIDKNGVMKPRNVTHLQFYAYRLAIRNGLNHIHSSRKLFLMYLLDAYMTVEGNRLKWIKENQASIMAENYTNLANFVNNRTANNNNNQPDLNNNNQPDPNNNNNNQPDHNNNNQPHLNNNNNNNHQADPNNTDNQPNTHEPLIIDGQRIGQRIILPATFKGSNRQFAQSYQRAMRVVAKEGKPDLFCTLTSNSNWREIVENTPGYDDKDMRPDIEARVFKLKLEEFLKDIKKKQYLWQSNRMYSCHRISEERPSARSYSYYSKTR